MSYPRIPRIPAGCDQQGRLNDGERADGIASGVFIWGVAPLLVILAVALVAALV